jgi:hypothetical protein
MAKRVVGRLVGSVSFGVLAAAAPTGFAAGAPAGTEPAANMSAEAAAVAESAASVVAWTTANALSVDAQRAVRDAGFEVNGAAAFGRVPLSEADILSSSAFRRPARGVLRDETYRAGAFKPRDVTPWDGDGGALGAFQVSREAVGGLEIEVSPRARFTAKPEGLGGGAGALVRFGRNLSEPRRGEPRWYFFAGADAQTVTWQVGRGVASGDALRLEEKTMIGDAQVGVAMRVGRGDLAFGFVHREITYQGVRVSEENLKTEEQFAGVSYAMTW